MQKEIRRTMYEKKDHCKEKVNTHSVVEKVNTEEKIHYKDSVVD